MSKKHIILKKSCNTRSTQLLLLILFVYPLALLSESRELWDDPSFEDEDYNSAQDPADDYSTTKNERKSPSRVEVCSKEGENNLCECIRGGNQTLKCGALGLTSADLAVAKEAGPIAIAHLERNSISYLFKRKILPGQERFLLVLDVSQNRIEDIEPGAFDPFPKLLELKLSQNNLNELSNDIFTDSLGSLHQLYLDYNFLGKLDDDLFDNLVNLKKLVLDGNRDLKISKKVLSHSLAKLEILSLDRCNLKELDEDLFDNLPNLRALSLSGNPLRKIPSAISAKKLPKLEILALSDTYISSLNKSELAKAVPGLKKLYMRRSRYLKRIDDCAFCGLNYLESLDFSESKSLSELDANAFGKVPPKELKQLELRNCNFSTLSRGTLKNVYWGTMQRLRLEGNPWNCDCQLKWLLDNDNAMRTVEDSNSPKCSSPEKLKGMSLYEARGRIKCGPPKESTTFMDKTMVLLVLMILCSALLIFGLLYTRRRFVLASAGGDGMLPNFLGRVGGSGAANRMGFTSGREMFENEFDEEEELNETETAIVEPFASAGVPRPAFV